MEGRVLMPWESKTVEELREFVLSAQDNINFSALCRKYGITRKTGYKWLKRHAAQMPLSNMSRKPSNVNRTPEDIELLIVSLRLKNPGWGAKKLKDVLEKDGHDIPSVKTVNNILNRYGCILLKSPLSTKLLSDLKGSGATKCGKPISRVNSRWQITTIVFPLIYLMTTAVL